MFQTFFFFKWCDVRDFESTLDAYADFTHFGKITLVLNSFDDVMASIRGTVRLVPRVPHQELRIIIRVNAHAFVVVL